jgi:hypothetical protein
MTTDYSTLTDEDLVKTIQDLAISVSYYNAAEGNWSQETAARNEVNGKFRKALNEMETRGIPFENKGYLL